MKITILLLCFIALTSCATKLTNEHITSAIAKIQPKLESCVQYHTVLNPNEQFRTTLNFRVSKAGKPQQASLSGIGNAGLEQCIIEQVNRLKFNIPTAKQRVFSNRLTFKIKS